MVLTETFRRQIEQNMRMKLQPPVGKTPDFDRRINGLPGDVLLALESLRMLADQGNRMATLLYEKECKRLGLWYEKKLFMPGGAISDTRWQ